MRGTFGAELSALNVGETFLNASKSEEENSRSSNNDHGDLDSEEVTKKFLQTCTCEASDEEHFHCKLDSCANALLGTTESASEHGRNHELEDRITALAYFTVDPANFDAQDSTIPCISAKCPYQTREKHYHCLWDGCSEIIVSSDGPFKRLDHFKAHEYSQKLDLTDKCDSLDGFFRRKRGRPPKNRIIEVSSGANEAIFTSFKLPKPIFGGALDSADTSDGDVKPGFLSYPEGTTCPDSSCAFNTSTSTCHYHCDHPRCHFSVADVHKLSLHLRDFHTNVDILEGYAYYDRNSDCRENNCEFNGSSEHFHCTRDGHGFMKYTTMIAHEAEYHENKSNGSSDDEDRSWMNQHIVKTSGTFYPLTPVQKKENTSGDAVDLSSSNGLPDTPETKPITDHSLSRILQLPSPESGETQFGPDVACGRPFCKLKRKCHFHCHLCNQAFSELDKLRPHVVKHSNFSPLKPTNESEDPSTDDESKNDSDDQPDLKLFPKLKDETTPIKLEAPSTSFTPTSIQNFLGGYPGSHSPYLFLQQNPLTSLYAGMMFGGAAGFPPSSVLQPPTPPAMNVPVPNANGSGGGNGLEVIPPIPINTSVLQIPNKIKRPPSASSSSPSSPPDSKKQRLQMRILKDEPVPEGYIRFRFNEDCQYTHCGYREHQTHFHCTREDCGYSFCDKTRFVQHTARHERLDTLMGGDFKQYRANISCGRVNCSYVPNIGANQGQNKASHFHCSKCDFVCTDTNKVVAHRRQHQKLDSIMAAGFEKFTPSQHCHIEACIHAQKQTHYHCLKCSYAVLGLSQMSAHKYRHVD
ncbi:unnamed protein product [Allacma fusca]|uniref:C2H2-type domain-containing protein n=1 Tax=Allacma fusca TaxID=39272 RepID=A0A8J2JY75_9HEXA|nr:unnamed protein product [Allacma fusca]